MVQADTTLSLGWSIGKIASMGSVFYSNIESDEMLVYWYSVVLLLLVLLRTSRYDYVHDWYVLVSIIWDQESIFSAAGCLLVVPEQAFKLQMSSICWASQQDLIWVWKRMSISINHGIHSTLYGHQLTWQLDWVLWFCFLPIIRDQEDSHVSTFKFGPDLFGNTSCHSCRERPDTCRCMRMHHTQKNV